MKCDKPLIKAHVGDIVCDTVFLNPVHNAKYWFINLKKGDGDETLRLKQIPVLLPNIIMMKIYNDKNCPRGITTTKVEQLEVLIISNNSIDELLEEMQRRDKFNKEFGIEGGVSEEDSIN